jgi:hypothetical protein
MQKLTQIIIDILTGIDGESYDVGRVLGVLLVLVFIGISIYAYVVLKQSFNPVEWGSGAGVTTTGIGALLKLKEKTEPGQ